jgi:hypothetical protein
MDEDYRILPGAFGDKPQTVPLVIYEPDGTRRIVGEATLTPTEVGFDVSSNVTDPAVKKMLEAVAMLPEFAIYDQTPKKD